MADQLTLPNGTPYNIVFKNGRAYFAADVFGNVGVSLPQELLIVPAGFLPNTYVTYKGVRYAYMPESAIVSYVNSAAFKNIVGLAKTDRKNVSSPITLEAINTARASAIDTSKTFDQTTRSNGWSAAKPKTDKTIKTIKQTTLATTGAKIPPKGPQAPIVPNMGGRGESTGTVSGDTGFWSALKMAAGTIGAGDIDSSGAYTLQQNQKQIFLYAGPNGKIIIKDPGDFVRQAAADPPETIKANQNLLKKAGFLPKSYKATGIADMAFRSAMFAYGTNISMTNWEIYNAGMSGTTKPYGFESGLNYYAKNPNYGGYGGSGAGGVGGTRKQTDTEAMTWTTAEARTMLEDFYATAVGRRPNQKEVEAFNNLINQKAKAKPTVTTRTTTTSSTGKVVSSKIKTEKGYGQAEAAVAARQKAEADPRSHAFLTNTKYFDVLLNAVRQSQF